MKRDGSLRLFVNGPSIGLKLSFLLILALASMVIDSRWSSITSPFRSLLSTIIAPVRYTVYLPGEVVHGISVWSDAINALNKESAELENLRISLAQEQTQYEQVSAENMQLRRLLGVKENVSTNSVAVEILYTPADPLAQTLVLNKGSDDGIEAGMPVIGEGGVIGQIRRVNARTSEVALITDDKIAIPAMVLRNGLRVIVFGSGHPSQIEVHFLPNNADIKPGDKLITSGIGGLFPPGLSIGTVTSLDSNSSDGFLKAFVEPSAHPERYRHFLVLLTKPEGVSNE
ncbi:rod shape-determining protein MreC [Basilea psittacipulmonis]|uniref:Cell shape-determining protein MreC n=1 Tax=Basilea psittacipulmonis DSM 24701 TaxID=1072685 RepID=A0A077DG29_9BURK|nr:rod shape-determining protein MreC [Basilea psittacipulmonis]AIL32113.1 rod shape-determining protein MreC [Basilea psittacipulmonis DSM 24701]